jgi:hypothetical protein
MIEIFPFLFSLSRYNNLHNRKTSEISTGKFGGVFLPLRLPQITPNP